MRNKKWLIFCAMLAAILLLGVCVSGSAADEYRTLKQGMEGKDVLRFKQAMYWLGYFTTENVSDQYNGTTVERVRILQENNGFEPDGVATPELQELVFSGKAVKTDTAPNPSPVPTPSPTPVPPKGPEATPDMPSLTDNGFLDTADENEEYVYIDADDGLWIYKTSSLSIDLRRYTDVENHIIWFEGDIYTSEASPLTAYLTEGKKPGYNYSDPRNIAKQNKVVLAFTDDHFGDRWHGGSKTGIIIRNGQIIREETHVTDKFPNLEILAVFRDGSMKTFKANAYTAQEYLDMGVVNTYAFGPILVTEGQLSEWMLRDEYYTFKEPRCSIGMIEPNHYFLLVAKGRSSDSDGVYLTWLADKMLEKGVVEGMNLDGGGTVALMFMGEMLNKSAIRTNIRDTTSITGFGNSDLVPEK